nr:integrase, catalytic region, zinc finger, CCHC-type, peptidase aspartic, catalytic [Tanacetum cinerariifolium]
MPNPEDIIDPTTAMNMTLALMAKAFKPNYSTPTNNNQRISSNPRNRQIAQSGINMGQDRQMQMVGGNNGNLFRQYAGNLTGNGNHNLIRNGNLVAARAEGNAAGQNGNQIRCYNYRGVGHYTRNCTVRPRRRDDAFLQKQLLIAHKEEAGIQLQAEEYDLMAATDSAPVYDLDGLAEVHENCDDNEIFNLFTQKEQYTELLEPIPESHQVPQNDNNVISKDTSMEQEETLQLAQKSHEKMKQLNKEIKPTNYTKINHLLEVLVRQTAMSREELYFSNNSKTANVSKSISIPNDDFSDDTTPSVARKFLNEGKSKDTSCVSDTRNPLTHKLENKNVELESQVLNYARENAHLKATYKNLFDSIYVSRTQTKTIIASLQNELQSTIYKNGKLRTQLFKKVSDQKDNTHDTSVNTNFAKQLIMENLPKVGEKNALSKPVTSNSVSTPQESKGVDNTKTRRQQPMSNSKHDKVPSTSKSSQSKNKEAEVEEHHRNLPLSKNNKHISSACNNIKIDSQDVMSKVVCDMCKKCLISVNHDKCLHNYVNGKNSRGKKQKAKVSFKENQMKYQRKVTKPKKVIQICLWFVDSGCSKHMTGYLKILINFVWKFMGTVRFKNDHVAAILGFGDLQWGNIMITRVYFVEGLGHNLFSIGQFCNSDLEVTFRRNACFVRNLEGVNLLKEDRSTKLYTINLYEMASASFIHI